MAVSKHNRETSVWALVEGLQARLVELWGEGVTITELGRILTEEFFVTKGLDIVITRNAALGKAHRLIDAGLLKPHLVQHKPAIKRATLPEPAGPTCMWPFGDPGEEGFHFCGVTPLRGKAYCVNHAAVAYLRKIRPEAAD